jgi:hypothetical protein
MKTTTKLYLKTFLFTGIPYGLIMTGYDLAVGNGFILWKFLFLTFFFGITMSLFFVLPHKNRLKKIGNREVTTENLKLIQTKNIQTKLNKKELIEKLKTDQIIGKMKMVEMENGILLKSDMTWKSWGEEIKILLISTKDTEFEYKITSRPRVKITLLDYGKNLENIHRIETVIK